MFDDSLSIEITKSSKILIDFSSIIGFTLISIHGYQYLVLYAFVIEFEVDYRFTFTYLPSFDIFVLTFHFFLCRLFRGCKDSIESIDTTIINEQYNEAEN